MLLLCCVGLIICWFEMIKIFVSFKPILSFLSSILFQGGHSGILSFHTPIILRQSCLRRSITAPSLYIISPVSCFVFYFSLESYVSFIILSMRLVTPNPPTSLHVKCYYVTMRRGFQCTTYVQIEGFVPHIAWPTLKVCKVCQLVAAIRRGPDDAPNKRL